MLEELALIADSLSVRLRRSVAIDDPRMRLLVHTAHHGETVDRHRVESIMQKVATQEAVDWAKRHGIEHASAPVRIPANPGTGYAARICVQVRHQDALHAYLWLLDQGAPLTDADLELAVAAANAAGRVLHDDLVLGNRRRARDRELLRDLLAPDETVREQAARQLHLQTQAVVVALRSETDPAVVDLAMRHATARLAPSRCLWATDADGGAVLLVAARRPPAADLVDDLRTRLGTSVRAGIGPVVSIATAHESHDGALDALRVAERVPGFGAVSTWDSLGVYQLLVRLPPGNGIPAGLSRLLDNDETGVLGETLEVYLDVAGSTPATVARLRIHRTSLYYRLRRIEELTGMSLGDGGDRLALHLGIKLVRLTDRPV
jgi:hypothetical protein